MTSKKKENYSPEKNKNKSKAKTNLDNILKNRDITLLRKVHIVKAIIFPLVMYECES